MINSKTTSWTLGLIAAVSLLVGCETLQGGYPTRGIYVGGGHDFSYTAEQDGVLHVYRHGSKQQIGSYSLAKGQSKRMDQPELLRAMYGGRRVTSANDKPILVDLHFEPTLRPRTATTPQLSSPTQTPMSTPTTAGTQQ